jgi:hypothetical protein
MNFSCVNPTDFISVLSYDIYEYCKAYKSNVFNYAYTPVLITDEESYYYAIFLYENIDCYITTISTYIDTSFKVIFTEIITSISFKLLHREKIINEILLA